MSSCLSRTGGEDWPYPGKAVGRRPTSFLTGVGGGGQAGYRRTVRPTRTTDRPGPRLSTSAPRGPISRASVRRVRAKRGVPVTSPKDSFLSPFLSTGTRLDFNLKFQ